MDWYLNSTVAEHARTSLVWYRERLQRLRKTGNAGVIYHRGNTHIHPHTTSLERTRNSLHYDNENYIREGSTAPLEALTAIFHCRLWAQEPSTCACQVGLPDFLVGWWDSRGEAKLQCLTVKDRSGTTISQGSRNTATLTKSWLTGSSGTATSSWCH